MAGRQESIQSRGKRKGDKIEVSPIPERAKKSKKSEKVVEVKLATSRAKAAGSKNAKATGAEKPGGRAAAVKKGSPTHRKRAMKAEQAVEPVPSPTIPIDQMDSAETHRLIQSFRKVSAKAQKQRVVPRKVNYSQFLAKAPNSGKKYTIDLRVHTPGTVGYFTSGGVEPGPALVRLAKVKGLDIIGLTDFYNASFIDIVQDSAQSTNAKLASKSPLTILPGIDFCCEIGPCRDVHVTALFPETYRSADLTAVLQELKIPDWARGRSDYRFERPFEELLLVVEKHGGLIVPSQLDKTPYRQLAIPTLVDQFGFRVFDLVHPDNLTFFRDRWPDGQFVFLSFSNSTALAQIGTRMATVKMVSPDFKGLKALAERRRNN